MESKETTPGIDLTANWYERESIINLIFSKDNEQVRYVFLDEQNEGETFKNQFAALFLLSTDFNKPVKFICKEPGKGGASNNHWIAGYLYATENKLILINPTGITNHEGFYEIVREVKSSHDLKVYLSTDELQKDSENLSSCGPICVELLNGLDLSALNTKISNCEQKEKHNLKYFSFSLDNDLLPSSLKEIGKDYEEKIEKIRKNHNEVFSKLEKHSYVNSPIQVFISSWITNGINMLNYKDHDAYKELKEQYPNICVTENDELLAVSLQREEDDNLSIYESKYGGGKREMLEEEKKGEAKPVTGYYADNDVMILIDALLAKEEKKRDINGIVKSLDEEKEKELTTMILATLEEEAAVNTLKNDIERAREENVKQILVPIHTNGPPQHWYTLQLKIESKEIKVIIHDSLYNREESSIITRLRKNLELNIQEPRQSNLPKIQKGNSYCGGYTARLIVNLENDPDADGEEAWGCGNNIDNELREEDARTVNEYNPDRASSFGVEHLEHKFSERHDAPEELKEAWSNLPPEVRRDFTNLKEAKEIREMLNHHKSELQKIEVKGTSLNLYERFTKNDGDELNEDTVNLINSLNDQKIASESLDHEEKNNFKEEGSHTDDDCKSERSEESNSDEEAYTADIEEDVRLFPRCEYYTRFEATTSYRMDGPCHWNTYFRSTSNREAKDRYYDSLGKGKQKKKLYYNPIITGEKYKTKQHTKTGAMINPFAHEHYKKIILSGTDKEDYRYGEFLYDEILRYKRSLCDSFLMKLVKYKRHESIKKNFEIFYSNGYPCIGIKLVNSKINKVSSKKIDKKAFSLLTMAYYVAFTNLKAIKYSIPIELVIRSSFGHNIPSLAETASEKTPCFRLNIGLVPTRYLDILIKGLSDLSNFISHQLNQQLISELVAQPKSRTTYIKEMTSSQKYIEFITDQVMVCYNKKESLVQPIQDLLEKLKSQDPKETISLNSEFDHDKFKYLKEKIKIEKPLFQLNRNLVELLCKIYKVLGINYIDFSNIYRNLEKYNLKLIKTSGRQVTEDGLGSDSEYEYEYGINHLFSKKLILATGMRAINMATCLTYIYNVEDIDCKYMYFEVSDAIEKLNRVLPFKEKGKGKALFYDLNHYSCEGGETPSLKDKIANMKDELKVIVLDYTSSTTNEIKKAIDLCFQDNTNVHFILLVSSGIKNEQMGADINPYGVLRIITKDKQVLTDLYSLSKALLERDAAYPKAAHQIRKNYKKHGFVVTNEQIFNHAGFYTTKKEKDYREMWIDIEHMLNISTILFFKEENFFSKEFKKCMDMLTKLFTKNGNEWPVFKRIEDELKSILKAILEKHCDDLMLEEINKAEEIYDKECLEYQYRLQKYELDLEDGNVDYDYEGPISPTPPSSPDIDYIKSSYQVKELSELIRYIDEPNLNQIIYDYFICNEYIELIIEQIQESANEDYIKMVEKFLRMLDMQFDLNLEEITSKGWMIRIFQSNILESISILSYDRENYTEDWINEKKQIWNSKSLNSEEKDAFYCTSITYNNPILNDQKISELFKLAKYYFGIKGVDKLIDIGLTPKRYEEFQNLRKLHGDEKAVKYSLQDQLADSNFSNQEVAHCLKSKEENNNIKPIIIDAQGRKVPSFLLDEATREQLLYYAKTGILFDSAKRAIDEGYSIVIQSSCPKIKPKDECTALDFNGHTASLFVLNEKSWVQLIYFSRTGTLFESARQALEDDYYLSSANDMHTVLLSSSSIRPTVSNDYKKSEEVNIKDKEVELFLEQRSLNNTIQGNSESFYPSIELPSMQQFITVLSPFILYYFSYSKFSSSAMDIGSFDIFDWSFL